MRFKNDYLKFRRKKKRESFDSCIFYFPNFLQNENRSWKIDSVQVWALGKYFPAQDEPRKFKVTDKAYFIKLCKATLLSTSFFSEKALSPPVWGAVLLFHALTNYLIVWRSFDTLSSDSSTCMSSWGLSSVRSFRVEK